MIWVWYLVSLAQTYYGNFIVRRECGDLLVRGRRTEGDRWRGGDLLERGRRGLGYYNPAEDL